jgi:RNA polymerase sigma factor (sigma-70 family)
LLFRRAPPPPTAVSTRPIDDDDSSITNVVVRDALELLPPKQRAVAVLCLYLELQPKEAAQIMRVRPSTARVHLHRARQTLAAALADDLDEALTRREPG